jgi:hypothetical protein
LNILVLTSLFRLGVRRYPLIFCYLTVTFLIAAVQAPISLMFQRSKGATGPWYQWVNSVGEICASVLMMSVVLSFAHRATASLRTRRVARTVLFAGAVVLMIVSLLVHWRADRLLGEWMAPWTRDVHFGAALLDLAAWGLLVAARQNRDSGLLILTGGMGIMFAGEAAARALQSIAVQHKSIYLYYSGHLVKVLADCAFFYVWWQAFRGEAKRSEAAAERARAIMGGQ